MIVIAWRLRTSWRAEPLLRRIAQHVAAAEGFRCGHLSIVVVGDAAMSTLHRRYLDLSGPTDVLTFDLGSDRRAGRLDAEIILCADAAGRQARTLPLRTRRGRSEAKAARGELALYLTHGILHLSGYDDHTPRGFQRMHAREDELLTQMGLGPLFSRGY